MYPWTMNEWHFYPWFHLLTLLSIVLSLWLAYFSWRRRPAAGALPTAMAMLAAALWAAGVYGEHASSSMVAKLWWVKIQYPGIACLSVCWFAMVFDYLGYHRLITRKRVLLLAFIPLLAVLLNWSNSWHHIFYQHTWIEYFRGMPMLGVTHGWGFWIFAGYVYLLNFSTLIACLYSVFTSTIIYRYQAISLLVASCIPISINLLYLTGHSFIQDLDLTPLAFSFSVLILVWGYRRHQLWTLSPVVQHNLIQRLPDGVLVLDTRHVVVSLNPAAARLLKRADEHMDIEVVNSHTSWLNSLQLSELISTETEQTITVSSDPWLVYEVIISPLSHHPGRAGGWLLLIRDVSERFRLEKRLQELAYYDPLTGLPNRRAGEDILARALIRGKRYETSTAVLFIDLDGFKEINDNYGHHIGDSVLQQTGYRLVHAVRSSDTICRFGGDEFVLILPDIVDSLPGITVERILAAFTDPLIIGDLKLNLTMSIGIAVSPQDGDSVEQLLVHSDKHMYAEKRANKQIAQQEKSVENAIV